MGVHLRLGSLADNGGFVPTMRPLPHNPAIDARGVRRPVGPHCDIGAVEEIERV
jgi:hypothetical protein